jgi:hypothetical protein
MRYIITMYIMSHVSSLGTLSIVLHPPSSLTRALVHVRRERGKDEGEREGGREGGREEGRKEGREGGREEGRKGGSEGGREGGREQMT